jgi:uncharacterized membrane protein
MTDLARLLCHLLSVPAAAGSSGRASGEYELALVKRRRVSDLSRLRIMKKLFHAPIRTFVAGLVAVLPVIMTVAVIVWVGSVVDQFVGPTSGIGRLLISIGLRVVDTKVAAYLIGIVFVFTAIYMLGVFVQAGLKNRLQSFVDGSLGRIPIIGNVYNLAHRFVGMLDRKQETDLKSMSPVWCFFGGEGGTAVLALRPTSEPVMLDGRPYHAIMLPGAPVPMGGALLYIPAEWIKPASFGVEGLTSIYVSMGITTPQFLRTA